MTRPSTVVCVLAFAPFAAAQTVEPLVPVAKPDPYAGNACVECHRQQTGRLADMVDLEWAKSIHYPENVGCEGCHGGDATLKREDFTTEEEFKKASHATFSAEFLFLRKRTEPGVSATSEAGASYACRACHTWTVEKGLGNPHTGTDPSACLFQRYGGVAMSRERGIAYICATCHPETTEKELSSPHGRRGAPSCLFCHSDGTHNIKAAGVDIIDPRPREERGRCSLCHKPDTMNAVAHVRATLEKSDELIKVASEQYEVLRKFGYRNLALTEMHDHLDDVRTQLRYAQHSCNLLEINELAKSIENVAKRVAYDHDLVLALRQARGRQTEIALGVAGMLLVLVCMLLAYRNSYGMRPWDTTLRDPVRRNLTPPCNDSCPAGNDVQGFIAAAVDENYDEALRILLRTTPFPSVCGRVCRAPCMDACNRRLFDESINIRDLERYVGDHATAPPPTEPHRRENVAVVGSGPAGLSAAYHLAKLGYPVTVFEREAELGGVMRTGIPGYRLPRDVLDREIGRIVACGVVAKTGHAIKREDVVRLSHEFGAVFVATGLQTHKALDLDHGSDAAPLQGIEFLDLARRGGISLNGKAVVIIGGGNVAIDVARTAVRLSASSVGIFCLERRDEMPAHDEEVAEAVAEGIEIVAGWGPVTVKEQKGRGSRVEFRRCMSAFNDQGLFAPTFDDEDRMLVDADTVILAVGQAADLSILPEGAEVRDGEVTVGRTGAPIFAGGDFAASEGTVTAAIGSGRRAAWHIHRMITGENLFPAETKPVATPDHIRTELFTRAPRKRGGVLDPVTRRTDFVEVNLGFASDDRGAAARSEAERCFSCGVCNKCDRCAVHCPEGIVTRTADGYRVDLDYCRGCGTCASECPRGVVYMHEWQVAR